LVNVEGGERVYDAGVEDVGDGDV